ncbi:MAG: helix-turn-helix transcriptional regulator [Bacteroidaceae bacterium]|nr:helix-turn-helix transcriptional regulator [Bacteroidaceae bacterium]
MELMQFTAIVLMIGLTLKLLLLPRRVEENSVTGRSRWLMFGGTALMGVQFVLQMALGLREKGVTQAVMLNLTVFTLVSWLLSLAILQLLTQGRLSRVDAWLGGGVWAAETVLIAAAAMTDGETLLSDSPLLQTAETVGSVLYFAMQCYYMVRVVTLLRYMRNSLHDYYDYDISQRIEWMQVSIWVLAVLSLFVPAVIFAPGRWLMGFAVVFFYGTWYFVDSFCDYVKSSIPRKVQESEEVRAKNEEFLTEQASKSRATVANGEDEETAPGLADEQQERVAAAIAQWTAQGGHRKSGLNKSMVAGQMGVSVNQLSQWLRHRDQNFWDWLSDLRTEEAKRIISLHPNWTHEAIADACGFNDRSAFQKKFKQKTGMTPAEWAEQGK